MKKCVKPNKKKHPSNYEVRKLDQKKTNKQYAEKNVTAEHKRKQLTAY